MWSPAPALAGLLCLACAASALPACPCADPAQCVPISSQPAKEVVVFVTDSSAWRLLDWSRVTTAVLFAEFNADMLCHAHSVGARVVFGDNFPAAQLANATARAAWIASGVQRMRDTFTDGVNIDFESAVEAGSPQVAQLSALVADAAAAYRRAVPGAQVSFDVAWSPRCVDGRCFNATALAAATDFLLVMDYDTRSQLNAASCAAGANAPLFTLEQAVANYTALGIAPARLVLGVPWYGYDYPCEGPPPPGQQGCAVRAVPFRGAPCSDAAGVEVCYTPLRHTLAANATAAGRMWDAASQTPYFRYVSPQDARTHEVWYDDPESLALKYRRAAAAGLRGIGVWEANCVDYEPGAAGDARLSEEMWRALDAFLRPMVS